MKDIEKVHKEVGEYNQKQIDKFIELYIEIKERYIDYKVLKNSIFEQAKKEGPGVYESTSGEGNIHLKEFKSKFRSVLKKEFNKLDIKKKRELFKKGLLKVHFRLDSEKFQKLKDKNLSTEVDEFAIKRGNNLHFFVKLNETIKKRLSELEKKSKDLEAYSQFAFEDKIEQMYEAIEQEDSYSFEKWVEDQLPDFDDEDSDN